MNINSFNISLILHIFGFIMWVGSLLIVSRILALNIKQTGSYDMVWPKKLLLGWLVPGMLISLVTGLIQASLVGFSFYFKQGWFHGKLTLVILLVILSGIFISKTLGRKLTTKSAMIFHGLSGLSVLLIIILTILGTK